MSRLIYTYFTLPLFCISYYIYKYTHTHTWFLSTLVCSCSRALCYCFAFAASATPPPPVCWHLVRNSFVPLALMPTALNIVSCLWCQWGKTLWPNMKKILRISKVIVVYNWHRFIRKYVCVCMAYVHGCKGNSRDLLWPQVVLLLLFAARPVI